ncbi:MAG: hypothetical protein KGZ82_04420 [Bacteroidales bacterium]|nr:hypothetical protein [Bacteroidales bacterium]
MEKRIKKAKIKGRSLEVELTESVDTGNGPVTNEVVLKCTGLVHGDLLARFDRLKIHLVKICDMKKSETITAENIENFDLSILDDYQVKGFSIGGDDEHEGVVLIGAREFESGKILNLVSPFTKFSDGHAPYEFESDLYNDVQACVYEVELYLEGKYLIKQLGLFDEEEQPVEHETEAA